MADFIFEKLSELSSDELLKLQMAIEEEFTKRKERKYRDLLKEWAVKETRAVKHMSFQSKQGWIVVVVVFSREQQEMFREIHTNKDQAHELAAKTAYYESVLIGSQCEPMEIW